jgi:hypothetical protein
MKKQRNPVGVMDSVDALSLLKQCEMVLRLLWRQNKPLALLEKLREQQLRHARALRHVIGTEPV